MLRQSLFRLALVAQISALMLFCPRVHAQDDAAPEDDGSYSDEYTDEADAETPDVEVKLDKTKSDKKTIIRSVRGSDSLQGILSHHGFTIDDTFNLMALPSWPKHYQLVSGMRYLVSTKDADASFVEIIFFVPRSSQVLKITKEQGRTEMNISDFNFDLKIKQVTGEVKGSLFSSLRRSALDGWAIIRFMDAYALDYKLDKQVKSGAKFSVTYEEKLLNGQSVASGEVLQTSIEIDGKKQDRYFVKGSAGGGVFVATDADHEFRPFFSPIEYLHISSPYTLKRFHPIRRKRRPHLGTDFALTHGYPVLAAQDGKIKRIGRDRGPGNFIQVLHNNGYFTNYLHLSKVDPKLRVGVDVKAGQKLGEVGCTGLCTKPHLHFEIGKDDKKIDPVRLMKPYTVLQENKVKEFLQCVTKSPATECAQKL